MFNTSVMSGGSRNSFSFIAETVAHFLEKAGGVHKLNLPFAMLLFSIRQNPEIGENPVL